MRKATRIVAMTLGLLAGIAGAGHGVTEILQGNIRPASFMFASIRASCRPGSIGPPGTGRFPAIIPPLPGGASLGEWFLKIFHLYSDGKLAPFFEAQKERGLKWSQPRNSYSC